MVALYICLYFIVAVIFFIPSYNVLRSDSLHKRNAVILTSIIIGLFWPMFIIGSIALWVIRKIRIRKTVNEIEEKLNKAFGINDGKNKKK